MALKLQRHEAVSVLATMRAAETGKPGSSFMSVQFVATRDRVVKFLRKTGGIPDMLKDYVEKLR